MKELLKRLNLKVDENNEFWQDAFAKANLEPEIPFFIDCEYVKKIQTEYGVFPKNFDLLMSAVDEIKKNKDLCMLAKIFYHLFSLRIERNKNFNDFELPKPPKNTENTLAYDLFSVFPILAHIPKSYAILKEKGVDDDVCRASHCQLDTCISEASEEFKRPCFSNDYFLSYGAFIYLNTLRIGRFRFQMAKESNLSAFVFENEEGQLKILMHGVTLDKQGYVLGAIGHNDEDGSFPANVVEEKDCFIGYAVDNDTYLAQTTPTKLDKSEWSLVYKPNDAVIMVHIPYADSFDKDYCEKSYARAREIFSRCYPEYDFKCFTTATWFLAPVLDKVLKPTSNIYHFRKKYYIFPNKCGGLDVFNYVYKLNPSNFNQIDLQALPEDNSLRKGIKERLLNGEYVHEFKGVFKF